MRTLVATVVALSMGCALPAADGPAPSGAQAAITVDHQAVVRFQSDWNELVAVGPVYAGGTLRVQFDPARLPACRATKYGLPAWSILAYARFDGGNVVTRALGAQGASLEGVFDVPEAATSVELWFGSNDAFGCREWDTNFGQNYGYTVVPPVQAVPLRFAADWTESADAGLEQGGLFRIHYAPERLGTCRQTTGGARAWNIYASWRFLPGGQTGTAALYSGDPYAPESAIGTPTADIPDDATAVQLWFSNADTSGCVAWDSDFGKNYQFPVGAPGGLSVGWAGDLDFVLVGAGSDQHRGPVDPAYSFDSWGGQGVAGVLEVQTWAAGLTDAVYGSASAAASAASALRGELVLDPGTAAESSRPLAFARQQGNNFVYSFALSSLRSPLAGSPVALGEHRYAFRFSVDAGATWTPVYGEDGGRRLVLATTLNCADFPAGGPPECPKAKAVGWVGNWGGRFTHACTLVSGLPEPVVFAKSGLGHDCMVVTAEVYVAGLTDAGQAPSAVLAEVETTLGFGGGPLATPARYPLAFDGQSGNNFRFAWSPATAIGYSDKGDYTFRFRFSADGGKTWTVAGKGDAARTLRIIGDSTELVPEKTCDGVQFWDGASNSFPGCVAWATDADFDASFCEHWLNALGRGQWSHNGTTMTWLEAYTRLGANAGNVLGVGMWVRYHDGTGAPVETWSYGTAIEPGYYRTGFTTSKSGGSGAFSYTVDAFAFFIDVKRASGAVERLWQSAGGANYSVEAAFASPGYVQGIGSGSVEYVPEGSPVLSPKAACE